MSADPLPNPAGELDGLADELKRVLALADPVPDGWQAAAGGAYAWAAIDVPAACLVYDSRAVLGGRVGSGHVAGTTLRTMRFAVGPLAVELELDLGVDNLRVAGRVRPGRAVEVVALWPEGRVATTSDGEGLFHLDELPRRPLCLHVTGEPAVKTGWIVA